VLFLYLYNMIGKNVRKSLYIFLGVIFALTIWSYANGFLKYSFWISSMDKAKICLAFLDKDMVDYCDSGFSKIIRKMPNSINAEFFLNDLDFAIGSVDDLFFSKEKGLFVQGWAANPFGKKPFDYILVRTIDKEGVVIFSISPSDYSRKDVSDYLNNKDYDLYGWSVSLNIDSERMEDFDIEIWGIDTSKFSANRLRI